MLTLFRIVEPCGGAILIDGLDTATMGLADLRSRCVWLFMAVYRGLRLFARPFIAGWLLVVGVDVLGLLLYFDHQPLPNHPTDRVM